MKKFNLVFLPDSNYSDVIIEKFERIAPNINVYICLDTQKKYLKNKKVNFISSNFLGKYRGDFDFLNNQYKSVYFNLNSLITSNFYYKFIDKNENFKDSNLILMFWSGELYNHPAYKKMIYYKHSRKYKNAFKNIFTLNLIDKLLRVFKMPSYSAYFELNKKIDYFCGFFETEHEIYNKTFKSRSKFINFTFLDLTFLNLQNNYLNKKKENILIGNSGSLENNHIEVFNILKQNKHIKYDNIIVPLSYGNNIYIDDVIKIGKEYFGNSFGPITEFMIREEYNNKIANVNVAIFNHYIQQAVGNIFFMLYNGVRIYLNEKSPLYKGFLKKGFNVNSISEFNKIGLTPLDDDKKVLNKKLILELLSEEMSINYYKSIIEI